MVGVAVFGGALDAQVIFLLGILNVLSMLAVFFSCRCLAGQKFVQAMMQKNWYRKFYSLHCYYWWLFFASVLAHTLLAFNVFGWPF